MLERAAPVLYVLGILLLILAAAMLAPLWLMFADDEPGRAGFGIGVAATLGTGLLLVLTNARRRMALSIRQMFALTCTIWTTISLFGALPLYFSLDGLPFSDAVFESVSGITTTGATVLNGLDDMPRGILLWRGLLHWLGGIGIVVLAIAILPFLSIGGMRLFQTESSDWSEKASPRTGPVAKSVGAIYLLLTTVCTLGYGLVGMPWFDAIVHAMSTVATGGFANYDSSFGQYNATPSILWIASLFMMLGSLPFALFVALLKHRRLDLFRDQQVRGFLTIVGVASFGLFAVALFTSEQSGGYALTHAVFTSTSLLSTTGLASTDYSSWGTLAVMITFLLTFIGGCSGSTAGGLKVFRLQIGVAVLNQQLKQLLHGRGVFTQKYNDRRISDELLASISAFSFFYLITIAALALALSALGLDLVTALSGAATAVSNVGPGLGDVIGPAGNFAPLPAAAKWLLSAGMLLGRLEIMTVLVLFTPAFWRW